MSLHTAIYLTITNSWSRFGHLIHLHTTAPNQLQNYETHSFTPHEQAHDAAYDWFNVNQDESEAIQIAEASRQLFPSAPHKDVAEHTYDDNALFSAAADNFAIGHDYASKETVKTASNGQATAVSTPGANVVFDVGHDYASKRVPALSAGIDGDGYTQMDADAIASQQDLYHLPPVPASQDNENAYAQWNGPPVATGEKDLYYQPALSSTDAGENDLYHQPAVSSSSTSSEDTFSTRAVHG